MQALIDAVRAGQLEATIRVVISNDPDAPGLVRAREAGIETLVIPHRSAASRDDYDRALLAELAARGVSLVCLAGFMRRLGGTFCEAYPGAILNIHPSLLPAFPGLDAQRQALHYGVRVSGATVHFVTPELDAGPIVMQEPVPVLDGDTVEALADRILAVEHRLYPAAVRRILGGGWRIEGRRVRFDANG
jgi:phosphoribosylglycinamide formyltransferase-1